MTYIKYADWKPTAETTEVIDSANEILAEYVEQGFDLTLRQLYYQFVSRDLLANTQKSYNRLGSIIQKARDAGLVSWDTIKDRGRSLYGIESWGSPKEFLAEQASNFHLDPWESQSRRCQVWVEKDALSSVVARAASKYRVDYFPNKGYVSASSIWSIARAILKSGVRDWTILHLGDHDPSGIDMTRDINERLHLYSLPTRPKGDPVTGAAPPRITVKRIALNMSQVRRYNPPPNPAKVTDSRFEGYRDKFGDESWELDALEPNTIVDLIGSEIEKVIDDPDGFQDILDREKEAQDAIAEIEI